jgi:hypothetical protein
MSLSPPIQFLALADDIIRVEFRDPDRRDRLDLIGAIAISDSGEICERLGRRRRLKSNAAKAPRSPFR